jgi:hypothetical protein
MRSGMASNGVPKIRPALVRGRWLYSESREPVRVQVREQVLQSLLVLAERR